MIYQSLRNFTAALDIADRKVRGELDVMIYVIRYQLLNTTGE